MSEHLGRSATSGSSEPIPVVEMRDYREESAWEPVFDPKVGHTLREKIISTWRDREGRLMGSWRWAK